MPTDVIMPQMGESIFEGTITKWLKKPGDTVQRDEPLFEISTDKVDAEIPVARQRSAHRGQDRGRKHGADQYRGGRDWGGGRPTRRRSRRLRPRQRRRLPKQLTRPARPTHRRPQRPRRRKQPRRPPSQK